MFSWGTCKRRATQEMFVIWRHQNWSYAIRWKITDWLQKCYFFKRGSGRMCQRWPSKATSSRMWVRRHVWFVRGNEWDGIINTSSHDSHILKNSASVARLDLVCIWPRFNLCLAGAGSGTCLGPDPTATLAHICHSRQGRRLCYLRPGQIHGISHRARVSPGFPLWLATKEEDGEQKDRGMCVWTSVFDFVSHERNERLKRESC